MTKLPVFKLFLLTETRSIHNFVFSDIFKNAVNETTVIVIFLFRVRLF